MGLYDNNYKSTAAVGGYKVVKKSGQGVAVRFDEHAKNDDAPAQAFCHV